MSREHEFFGYNLDNIYLDNAASTLALQCVKDDVDKFLSTYGSIHGGAGSNSIKSTEAYEQARETILTLVDGNTQDHCCIFTSNTTDAINKLAQMYIQDKNTKVLISDVEHSANYLPWCKYATVVKMPTIDFKVSADTLESMLRKDKDRKIVALAGASNFTGYILDAKEIYSICKKYNVLFFMDNSQLAPHFRPSLEVCDVMAFSGHKMYAPYGAGVLLGDKSILSNEGLAPTGGGNILYVDPDDTPIYKEAPFMHECGTPNGVGAVAMASAANYLYNTVGEAKLEQHNSEIISAMQDVAQNLRLHGYNIYFCDTLEKRTPIMMVDNKLRSNKETVQRLNNNSLPVFTREGAFCVYRAMEKIKPELRDVPPIVNGELNSEYSLIRLSAGLMTDMTDITCVENILIDINKGVI